MVGEYVIGEMYARNGASYYDLLDEPAALMAYFDTQAKMQQEARAEREEQEEENRRRKNINDELRRLNNGQDSELRPPSFAYVQILPPSVPKTPEQIAAQDRLIKRILVSINVGISIASIGLVAREHWSVVKEHLDRSYGDISDRLEEVSNSTGSILAQIINNKAAMIAVDFMIAGSIFCIANKKMRRSVCNAALWLITPTENVSANTYTKEIASARNEFIDDTNEVVGDRPVLNLNLTDIPHLNSSYIAVPSSVKLSASSFNNVPNKPNDSRAPLSIGLHFHLRPKG